MIEIITLPWPPSNNTYYRHVGRMVLLSAKGRTYRRSVMDAVLLERKNRTKLSFGTARLRVTLVCYPPDRRKRDLDNICKGVLDALTKAGVWCDDSQIDHLELVRKQAKGGLIIVSIESIDEQK